MKIPNIRCVSLPSPDFAYQYVATHFICYMCFCFYATFRLCKANSASEKQSQLKTTINYYTKQDDLDFYSERNAEINTV